MEVVNGSPTLSGEHSTAFARESAEAAGADAGPSSTMLALFQGKPVGILDGMKRRNLPQMIKAVEQDHTNIPVGGTVAGVIIDVCKSPVSTVKGSLLWLHLVKFDDKGEKAEKTSVEITFPATGVIRNALAPGVDGEENARKVMLELKGHLFIAVRQANKANKQYGKEMTMWDVRTSAKPVAVDLGIKIN